jgi:hypothetical protein
MKKITVISILVVLTFSLFVSPRSARAAGNTYYVATNGSDSASGSQGSPWKTIQKAANVARAGDQVFVRGGTYREKVIVQNSGSAGSPIVFSAYPGEKPVIDANGISMQNYFEGGFTIVGKNYIELNGFRIINVTKGFGIVCASSDYCVIRNNQTHNTLMSGIATRNANHVTIDHNDVSLANNDGEQEMVTISGSAFVTVTNNIVHDGGPGSNGGEGIGVKDGSHDVVVRNNEEYNSSRIGIYVDAYYGGGYNITVDGNKVHNNKGSGIAVEAEKSGNGLNNILIINNVVYQNGRSGIILGDWGSGTLDDIAIVNNTVYKNGIGSGHGGIGLWCDRATDVIVRNNLVSLNEAYSIEVQGTPLSETTITHNFINGFRNQPNETRGSNYVDGDPRFVNASAADFSLLPASSAIDAGTAANAPNHDFADSPRPSGSAHDIGAFEYTGDVPTPESFFTNNFNASFSGWGKMGNVTWNQAAPIIGSHSIQLKGAASMSRAISTQGYSSVTLVIYLGAKSYENLEQLKLSWWDGSAWQVLTNIKNSAARENGRLNKVQFKLPAAAADNPNFKIRVQQLNADANDFGYVDEVQLLGVPK